jgi:hypothetical protein
MEAVAPDLAPSHTADLATRCIGAMGAVIFVGMSAPS